MKKVFLTTLQYYLFLAAVTGSIYQLIENPNSLSWFQLISLNIINIAIALLISYFGYKSQQKKDRKTI